MTRTPINAIIVQTGHVIFGAGETPERATADAVEWLDDAETPEDVEKLLTDSEYSGFYGGFKLLQRGDEEFDDYLEENNYYEQSDGVWYQLDD